MDSVALDWHKEIKPMHEDIRNMQATEAKKKSPFPFSASLWNTFEDSLKECKYCLKLQMRKVTCNSCSLMVDITEKPLWGPCSTCT